MREIIKYAEDHLKICPHDFAVRRMLEMIEAKLPKGYKPDDRGLYPFTVTDKPPYQPLNTPEGATTQNRSPVSAQTVW